MKINSEKPFPSIKPFGLYRHRNFLDINMLVVNVVEDTKSHMTLRVMYFLQRNKSCFDKIDKVVLKKRDLDNWREVNE